MHTWEYPRHLPRRWPSLPAYTHTHTQVLLVPLSQTFPFITFLSHDCLAPCSLYFSQVSLCLPLAFLGKLENARLNVHLSPARSPNRIIWVTAFVLAFTRVCSCTPYVCVCSGQRSTHRASAVSYCMDRAWWYILLALYHQADPGYVGWWTHSQRKGSCLTQRF